MKRIKCEVCGSTEIRKIDDTSFRCMSCGVKYEYQSIIKMYNEDDTGNENTSPVVKTPYSDASICAEKESNEIEHLERKIKAAKEERNQAEFTKYCQNFLEHGGDAEFVEQEKATFTPKTTSNISIEQDEAKKELMDEEKSAIQDNNLVKEDLISQKETNYLKAKIIKIAIPVFVALLVVSVTLIFVLNKNGRKVDSSYDKTYSDNVSNNKGSSSTDDNKTDSGYVSDNKNSASTSGNTSINSGVFDNYQISNTIEDETNEYINAPDIKNQTIGQSSNTSNTPSSNQSTNQDSNTSSDSNESTNSPNNNHTHFFSPPTCTQPGICSCGMTQGFANGHKWQYATCQKPMTCEICGATEGLPNNHRFNDATCSQPKKCKDCGHTEGTALEHTFVSTYSLFCINCGVAESNTESIINNISIITPKDDILQISSAKITGYNYEEGDNKYCVSVEFDVKYLQTYNAHEIYIKAFNSSGTLIGSDSYIRSGSEGHTATFSGSVYIPINEKVSKIEISY